MPRMLMHGATLNMYTIFLLVWILFPTSFVSLGQQLILGTVMAQLLLLAPSTGALAHLLNRGKPLRPDLSDYGGL